MKQTTSLKTAIDLLRTEAILERHLADTRQDIRRACADIAVHTPGIHTSPDATIDGLAGDASPSRILPDVVIVVAIEGDA